MKFFGHGEEATKVSYIHITAIQARTFGYYL